MDTSLYHGSYDAYTHLSISKACYSTLDPEKLKTKPDVSTLKISLKTLP